MTAPHALSDEAVDLVAAFSSELRAAGLGAAPSTLGGARSFCARYSPADFSGCPVEEQLALSPHLRRFAGWLMVTGRMTVTAEYLARARLRLGTIAAAHHPELRARVAVTAEMLGSDTTWVNAQWNTLCQLAAMHGVSPAAVTAEHLTVGGPELLAAFVRPDRPTAGHS
ncbi:MAG: hypothetical protein WEB55_06105, partial [Acidimicrobiia bacterium]